MLPVATVPSAVGTLQGPPQVSWDVLEVANVPSGVGTVTRELGRAGVASVPSGDGKLFLQFSLRFLAFFKIISKNCFYSFLSDFWHFSK